MRDILVTSAYIGALLAIIARNENVGIALTVAWLVWQAARVLWTIRRCVEEQTRATSDDR